MSETIHAISCAQRKLNIADLDGLPEGSEGVGLGRDKFLGDVALKAGIEDGLHDARII